MLPSLTLALIAGLLAGSEIPYFPVTVSSLLLVMVLCILFFERRGWLTGQHSNALCAVLLSAVVYWSVAINGPPHGFGVEEVADTVVDVTGRIVAPVQQAPDRLLMLVRLDESVNHDGRINLVRLTWRGPERMLFHGDRIHGRMKLRQPTGSLNPGGFDYVAYLDRQGIDAVATVTGSDAIQIVESGYASARWRIWNQFDRWRNQIRLAAIQSLAQPALGFYLGIIIGDRGYLDQELRDQFMVTGTVHLLSISGSHLGLVALLTFVVIRRLFLMMPPRGLLAVSRWITPTRIAALCTVVPVGAYACLAGAEVATIRSFFMVMVAMGALWLGQERRLVHAIAAAAAVILFHDPQALFDISFQLSFLSVLAIAGWLSWSAVVERDQEAEPVNQPMLEIWYRWGKESVVMSAVITLVTLPLVAFYFNQVPWLGLFTNVVAVPLMGLILVPVGLSIGLWHLIAGDVLLPFASTMQWLLDSFVAGVRVVSWLPGGEWHVAAPSMLTMGLFYASLCVLWCRWGTRTVRFTTAGVIVLLLSWWMWSPRTFLDGERFRVTFLDVGQGDSAVLELPDGQVVLIDGGSSYERFDMGRGVVAPYLWNRGIRTIDHVIGTHPQLDHVGGLAWLIRHLIVKRYWGSGERREEVFAQRLRQALVQQGLTESAISEGQNILSSGSCQLVALNPANEGSVAVQVHDKQRSGSHLNNNSVVTQLRCGAYSILFAADIERDAMARLMAAPRNGPVTVLKVPHHGAISSLHREWLASIHPQYAVISVGRHNAYGHPAPAILDAYAAQGSAVFRTDRDGGVWVTGGSSSSELRWHRTRDQIIQPVDIGSCWWPCEQTNWTRVWQQWQNRL